MEEKEGNFREVTKVKSLMKLRNLKNQKASRRTPVGWQLHIDGAVRQRCVHRDTALQELGDDHTHRS